MLYNFKQGERDFNVGDRAILVTGIATLKGNHKIIRVTKRSYYVQLEHYKAPICINRKTSEGNGTGWALITLAEAEMAKKEYKNGRRIFLTKGSSLFVGQGEI